MKSILTKFVCRINGGMNFYFVCKCNRVVREQYVNKEGCFECGVLNMGEW